MEVKRGSKLRERIFYLEKANIELDKIIALELVDKYSEISNEEFKRAQEICDNVFKKANLSDLGDLADLSLIPKS